MPFLVNEFRHNTNVFSNGQPARIGQPITQWKDISGNLIAYGNSLVLGNGAQTAYRSLIPLVLTPDGVKSSTGIPVKNSGATNNFNFYVGYYGQGTVRIKSSMEMWFVASKLTTEIKLFSYYNPNDGYNVNAWWPYHYNVILSITPTAIQFYGKTRGGASSTYITQAFTFSPYKIYHVYFACLSEGISGVGTFNRQNIVVNGTTVSAIYSFDMQTVGAPSWNSYYLNPVPETNIIFGDGNGSDEIIISDIKFYNTIHKYGWNTTFTPQPKTKRLDKLPPRLYSIPYESIRPAINPYLKGIEI